MKKIITTLCFFPAAGLALEALDDAQLSDVTGEGLGATFENVVLYSGDLGQPDDFEIKLYLEEGDQSQSDFLRFSELRLNKSGETPGLSTSGGRFGTFLDSFNLGTIVDKRESYGAQRVHTVWETAFPAADLAPVERSFLTYGKNNGLSYLSSGGHDASRYETLPNGFFPEPFEDNSGEKRFVTDYPDNYSPGTVNLGNLLSVSNNFSALTGVFDSELDKASDKFDLHFRVDSVTDLNRNQSFDDQFFASIDLKGLRLYGTQANVWARDVSEAGNNSGLAFALNTGLVADSIEINADPNGALGSRLSLEGVDAYLPLGTIDQPLTISTVQFRQQKRYKWRTTPHRNASGDIVDSLSDVGSGGTVGGAAIFDNDDIATTQLRIEIAALPQAAQQSVPGHITIRQLNFGDPDDPEIITGTEDIYLRNSAGQVVAKVDDVKHRAFVPKTVTYNEEVRRYNEANPGANLPYIPNENVIELKGIEIQRLVITTQDLNRSCDVCITN